MKQNWEIFIFSCRKHEFVYTFENRRVRSFQRLEEMESREQNDAGWEEGTGGKSSRRCIAGMAGPYGVFFKWLLFLRSWKQGQFMRVKQGMFSGKNFEKRTLDQSHEEQSEAFPGTQGRIAGSLGASQRSAPLLRSGGFLQQCSTAQVWTRVRKRDDLLIDLYVFYFKLKYNIHIEACIDHV